MNKAIRAIIIGIIIFGLVFVGNYIKDSIQTKRAVDEISRKANDRTSEPIVSPAEARVGFMQGCDTGDYTLQSEYCGCMWTQISAKYGVNQIMNDGLTLTYEQMQIKYGNEINYCTTTIYEGAEL